MIKNIIEITEHNLYEEVNGFEKYGEIRSNRAQIQGQEERIKCGSRRAETKNAF